jgi:hypothetical protein
MSNLVYCGTEIHAHDVFKSVSDDDISSLRYVASTDMIISEE